MSREALTGVLRPLGYIKNPGKVHSRNISLLSLLQDELCSPKRDVKALTPVPVKMALLGNRFIRM